MKAEWTNKDSLTSGETTKVILLIDIDEKHLMAEFNDLYDRLKGRKCELKPLPSYKAVDLNDTRDVMMFCHGWNTCLEEITGETE